MIGHTVTLFPTLYWILLACSYGLRAEKIDAKMFNTDAELRCLSTGTREKALNELRQNIKSIISTIDYGSTVSPTTTTMPSTSNAYIIPTGISEAVFTCNGTPGWRRIAFINMTDTSYNCPTGLSLTSYSKRTCGLPSTLSAGCISTTFTVNSMQYQQVCGRMRGYQFGANSAFHGYSYYGRGIDVHYVDGISLTHGGPGTRQHIWTFAAGINEYAGDLRQATCPCDTLDYSTVPPFVGNDYFCESAETSRWSYVYMFYPNDVLWDGQDCSLSSMCCQLNNLPWFTKSLPNPTTDDIEMRVCANTGRNAEDIPIELIELYIK